MPRKSAGHKTLRKPTQLGGDRVKLLVVGFYEVDEEEGPILVEGILIGPAYFVDDPENFRFYTPLGYEEPTPITRIFYLDPLGEKLVGSYLHPRPSVNPRKWPECMQTTRQRFVAILPHGEGLMTPFGTVLAEEIEPIPERLLRLIWLED